MKTLTVQEPWFSHIKNGRKIVEGRLAKYSLHEYYKINTIQNGSNAIEIKVNHVNRYNSFEEMLTKEGIKNVLPGIKTISEGISIYRQFYSIEDEHKYGVVAIQINL